MENRQQQILSEIKSMMSSIRSQLERLDAKMAELQQIVDPEDFEAESIDIEIDMAHMPETIAETVELQEDDLPFDDIPEEIAEPEDLPVEEVPEENVPDQIPAEDDDDDLPVVFEEPEIKTVAAKAKEKAAPTINDVMATDHAWRKDMPGTPVRDIRSAISLNDRVIFINLLFNEDAQTFVDTLSRINTMETLDQAVEYICTEFPSWDMNSELVYRFMMAVRRKVR
ncbi:MAG: hypothetical protein IJ971_02215 [Bacteroidales bacterium]|nr:hypothetical protein [Bacteroidales bacterium]